VVLRQGHLAERALTEALLTGERPAHLDRCDLCAARAMELGRWLDDVRRLGIEAVDSAFSAEQLQAQQAQIMRRLELLEQPVARVIAFPAAAPIPPPVSTRRVAAGWVGVAAAAGLVLGLLGGQLTARLGQTAPQGPAPAAAQATPSSADPSRAAHPGVLTADELLRLDLDEVGIPAFETFDRSTPRLLTASIGRR
jgi:hypothetical protein